MATSPFLSPTHSPSVEEEAGDGSSAGSSILGDGPGSNQAFRAKILAQNKPCSPTALSAALLSLSTQEEVEGSGSDGDEKVVEESVVAAGSGTGSEGSDAGSGSGSGEESDAAEPIASQQPFGAPLLEQPSKAPFIPPPPLGPTPPSPTEMATADANSLPPSQPPAPVLVASAPVGAVTALVGTRTDQPLGSRTQPPSTLAVAGAKAATTAAAAVGGPAEGEFCAASVDMVHFRRNQSELNRIRAQLKALKGKDLANYQRGRNVDGRNFKTGHSTLVQQSARQVFVKKSQPPSDGLMTNTASFGPSPALRQPPPPLSKPWVAAVSSNLDEKRFNLNFRPPNVVDGEIIVEASDESLNMARSLWSDYLVGYFLEGRLPFQLVEEIANRMWAKHGLIETLSYNKEFFLFKFPEASSREKLLDHGPFLFGGRPLILQQWTPSLVLSKACLTKIPLWVKIYNIPLAMWNPIGLGDIASAIGVPLFADSTTEKLQRFDFARICVEVDASKPLLDEFKLHVQGKVVKLQVVYQWRPKRCPTCCTFGHLCTSRPAPAPSHASSGPAPGLNHGSDPVARPVLTQNQATAGSGPVLAEAAVLAIAAPSDSDPHQAPTGFGPAPTVPTAVTVPVSAPARFGPVPAGSCPAANPTAGHVSASIADPVPAPISASSPAGFGPGGPSAVARIAPSVGLIPVGSLSADLEHYVEGVVEDVSEDDCEEDLHPAMYYSVHSPKTRGQKAMRELSLTSIPPKSKGSGKKGKKKGKRSKR